MTPVGTSMPPLGVGVTAPSGTHPVRKSAPTASSEKEPSSSYCLCIYLFDCFLFCCYCSTALGCPFRKILKELHGLAINVNDINIVTTLGYLSKLTMSTLCENGSVTRRKPKTRYHHGNLRAALIECGLELIQRKGIHALTLREIGQRLGVSRSAAYRHFKDKAALLFAISEAGFIEFGNVVEAARKEAGDGFAEQMDAMALAYARFADEHRAQFEVMFAAVLEPGGAAEAGGGRNLRILEEAIGKAQQTGEVRQGDPALLARVVWALVHGASMLRRDGDRVEPPVIRLSTEVLRSGLSSRQTPAVSHGLRIRQ